MAIDPITLGDTSARAKINAAIALVNAEPGFRDAKVAEEANFRELADIAERTFRIDADDEERELRESAITTVRNELGQRFDTASGQAARAMSAASTAQIGVADLVQTNIATLDLVKAAGKTADRAVAEAIRIGRQQFAPLDRPGDAPFAFTHDLAGSAEAAGDLTFASVVSGRGRSLRVTGAALIASKTRYPLEPGRAYRARYVVQRRSNASDPQGDSVRCGLAWLDSGYAVIAAKTVSQVNLLVASGRRELTVGFGLATGPYIDQVAPVGACYAVPYVVTFGPDGRTDLEVISVEDVTAATILPAPTIDLSARVDAVESILAGGRIDDIEQQLDMPSSRTFASRSDATAATIPNTVEIVHLLGDVTPGDGLGRDHRRIVGPLPAGASGFTSQDGAVWRRVDQWLRPSDFSAPKKTEFLASLAINNMTTPMIAFEQFGAVRVFGGIASIEIRIRVGVLYGRTGIASIVGCPVVCDSFMPKRLQIDTWLVGPAKGCSAQIDGNIISLFAGPDPATAPRLDGAEILDQGIIIITGTFPVEF